MHTRASNSERVEPLHEPERTLNRRLRRRNRRVPFDQRNNPPQHPRIVYPPILNINYFRHFLDILRNYDPMDDEPMWAADRVVAPTPGSAITIPKTANEFAIKGNHLTLVKGNQFDGRTKTDPHKHIHEFLGICDMFKYRDTKNEVVRLMMFPLSLTGEAKTWLDELNEGTIKTWDELRTAFISRFFPPALFDRLLGEIRAFSQHENESLTDAWLRMKEMLRNCHAYQLLEDKVLLKLDWAKNQKTKSSLKKTVAFADEGNSNSDTDKIMARMDAMTIKMDAQYKELQSHAKQPTPDLDDDDIPMSREEEAKFMQTFEDFEALLDEGNDAIETPDSESDTEDPPFKKITINTDYKIKTSLEEPPTDLELKPLPDNLEYVFLEEPSFLSVITPFFLAHLSPKLGKCHFMVKEGIVLGNKVSSAGFEVDKAKIDVISKLPPPTNIKGVRSFLRHAGFYRRFIKDFSKIARPITKLLEKDTPCAPVIVSPNWNLPFEHYVVCRVISPCRSRL
ncbi:reverse transcriptase domain-containing protein [Tanacetum coccineum]